MVLSNRCCRGLVLVCLTLLPTSGCVGGVVGNEDTQPGPTQPNNPTPNNPTNPGGPVNNPTTPNPATCSSDTQCTAPFVCNIAASQCVPPNAKNGGLCDPIEGIGCKSEEQCIGGVCMVPPSTCQTNDDCPGAFVCQQSVCVPDGGNGGVGCKNNSQCPQGQACVGGSCVPQASCNVPHAPDRMAGVWQLDSKLKVRDGLKGFTKGLLSLAGDLQNIINGKFSISGLPSFLSSIVGVFVRDLIKQYVPTWGLQVIQWLANVNDVLDEWRVISTESVSALGGDQYKGASTWHLVEFEYQGKKVSTGGGNVPGLGQITTEPWTAREVCGVFFIDKHKLKNKIGQIYRWGIEAMLTAISCANGQCFTNLNDMFQSLIDCRAFGNAVQGADSTIPGLSALVEAACTAEKQNFIKKILKELDDLSANMTYMSLRAKATIINNNTLSNGRWYGVLGGSFGKGNFEGNFTGLRK